MNNFQLPAASVGTPYSTNAKVWGRYGTIRMDECWKHHGTYLRRKTKVFDTFRLAVHSRM
jgi:hypothetical protein